VFYCFEVLLMFLQVGGDILFQSTEAEIQQLFLKFNIGLILMRGKSLFFYELLTPKQEIRG